MVKASFERTYCVESRLSLEDAQDSPEDLGTYCEFPSWEAAMEYIMRELDEGRVVTAIMHEYRVEHRAK
jgi:hypothetical protein